MRIAYLSTFYPYRGGIAQFNAALFEALSKKHEVKAYTFTRQYPSFLFPGKTQYAEKGDDSGDVKAVRVLDSINPFTYGTAAGNILKFKPALMLTKFWTPYFAPALGTVARKLNNKGVVNIAILDNVITHEKKFYDRLLTKYFLRQYRGFMVMSRNVADDLLSLVPHAKYRLHPHPLFNFGEKITKEEARGNLAVENTSSYILFFGFIRKYKGLDLLLESMADNRLKTRNIKLIIAGEYYEDSSFYLAKIKELGIEDRVVLHTHFIPSDKVRDYFCACDIVAQPYRSATQSGVTQIAYHFDKPMLVTDVGGLPEIVSQGKTGYVVPGEPKAIADALNDFYTNSREAEFAGFVAAEKKRFSWDSFAHAIEELYEEAKGES